MVINSAQQWFVLQTKSRSERKVERLLEQKGYNCFSVRYRQKRRWSDRTVEIDSPLFPMYVFCRFNPLSLGKVISTSGVTKIIGFGGKLAEVAAEEIEALQLLAQSNVLREPWRYLPNGVSVRVETGPLTGAQGVIYPGDNSKRLVISVTLLQRAAAIELDKDTVVSVVAGPEKIRGGFHTASDIAVSLLK
jgi:transcriptional antiterminator RfaH